MLGLVSCLLIVAAFSMPYQVPLQGLVGGKRTLVLLDDLDELHSMSTFFSDLRKRGHVLSFYQSDSTDYALKKFGEHLYDNMIFMAPTTQKLNSITFEDIQDFAEHGGNIMLVADNEVSDTVREFADSLGFVVDGKGAEVIDHVENDESLDFSLDHTYVWTSSYAKSEALVGSLASKKSHILYHGIAHKVDENSILSVKVLHGSPSSYSANPSRAAPGAAADGTLLVSGVQARNNARVTFVGSLDMFRNQLFAAKTPSGEASGNREFLEELSKWSFGERAVLRFRDIRHHQLDGTPPDVILHEKPRPDLPLSLYPDPEITRNSLVYRIKENIVYSMVVEQHVDGEWKPFCAEDMQMEFVMMDPYVRKTMTCDRSTGRFVASFIAPDSYGVFKFRVLYRRPGYSVLHAETQVSLRPFKHNEYERFIFSAYPYYSSAISATIAFFVFSVFFLFSSDSK